MKSVFGFRVQLQNPKSRLQNLNPDLHAWTSFIVARKRDCRRSDGNKLWRMKCSKLNHFAIGRGPTSFIRKFCSWVFYDNKSATFLESMLALFRTLAHCIRLKTMAITCMTYSGHQSTLAYSRLWTALEDWTCGTLTTILRYKFELYCFVWMHVKHVYYSHPYPISLTFLLRRYRQQVHIPNQWRHWTVCGGRIQGTRLPWVTMMVTCLFMTLARWENSNKDC